MLPTNAVIVLCILLMSNLFFTAYHMAQMDVMQKECHDAMKASKIALINSQTLSRDLRTLLFGAGRANDAKQHAVKKRGVVRAASASSPAFPTSSTPISTSTPTSPTPAVAIDETLNEKPQNAAESENKLEQQQQRQQQQQQEKQPQTGASADFNSYLLQSLHSAANAAAATDDVVVVDMEQLRRNWHAVRQQHIDDKKIAPRPQTPLPVRG